MPVLSYVENDEGKLRKSAFELVSYSKAVAGLLGTTLDVLVIGKTVAEELQSLARYGADRVLTISEPGLSGFSNRAYSAMIAEAANASGASIVILANSFTGKGIAPRLSVRLDAGLVTGVSGLPQIENGKFTVSTGTFSGKAIALTSVLTEKKVITLNPNSYPPSPCPAGGLVEEIKAGSGSGDLGEVVKDIVKASGKVPLPEASIIVSAGRGLKGPENWEMIEELSAVLGAATACSKPVSDAGWRPHEEHVGQTGLTVSPDLYIAIGISGAIQHLAGVSASKTIVVINKDPEAPFFKAADYGIVGDAFEVVPRLISALKNYKENL